MKGIEPLRCLAWVLLCSFFALGLLVGGVISISAFSAGALGLAIGIRHRLFSSLSREEKWLAASFGAFVLVSLLSALFAGFHEGTLTELEACLRYLLVVPILVLVRWTRPPDGLVWVAMMIGAAAAGSYVLGIAVIDSFGAARFTSGGLRSYLFFGAGTVTLGFASLMAYRWCRARGRLFSVLPLIALLLGLLAVMASGARSAWLALPALIFLVALVPSRVLPGALRVGLVGSIVVVGGAAWFVPQTRVADRVMVGVENIRGYQEEDGHNTSVGARLEMWKGAGMIFRDHPIMGVGPAGYEPALAELVRDGHVRKGAERHDHPHNEYLAVAVSRGALGLMALVLLLGVPGLLFWRAGRSLSPDAAAFAFAGLLMVAAFAVYGLANTLSVRTFYITWYTMSVSLLYGMVQLAQAREGSCALCDRAEAPATGGK